MTDIRPFRGIRYNQSLVKDVAEVICPPYDIISPAMQPELYHRSEYNFVRIEFNRELPQDTSADNKYTRSAATLEQWLKHGVLTVDKMPAIYLHEQYFTFQGKQYRRRGIIVRVKLEEWDKGVVHPHEGTLSEPKSDRLNLLWACQANTSPILALFEDRQQEVARLLAEQVKAEPVINAVQINGEGNCIWAITDPDIINQIRSSLASEGLYIADGHHRYESALTYRREKRAGSVSNSAEEPFDFVMMTLVPFADPGLLILPPHRLVRGVSKSNLSELAARLKSLFDIEEWPLSTPEVWQLVDSLFSGRSESEDRLRIVAFGLAPGYLSVLTLRDFASASQLIPSFHSDLYKRLDVSIIDHVILEKVLGLDQGSEATVLSYSYDRLEVVNRVLDQEYQLAFILSPVRVETIKAIADIGDRMPRKSTYFYPKLPSGLVINRLI